VPRHKQVTRVCPIAIGGFDRLEDARDEVREWLSVDNVADARSQLGRGCLRQRNANRSHAVNGAFDRYPRLGSSSRDHPDSRFPPGVDGESDRERFQ
jgi:hypothetical protein